MATSELNTRDSYLRKSFFEQTLEHHKRNSPVQTDGRRQKTLQIRPMRFWLKILGQIPLVH